MVNKWTRAPAPVPPLRGGISRGEDVLKPDFADWAKMPYWKETEAAALLCGVNPDLIKRLQWVASDSLKKQYDDIWRQAYRAIGRYNFGGWPPTPASWLAWAKKYDHPCPAELKAAVDKWGDAPSSVGSDDDARALIRTAIVQNGGFIGQKDGAGIVRKKFPSFNKDRAMGLVKEMTANDKPGPKGPRNNYLKNRP